MPTTVAAGSVAWSASTTPWLTQGTNPGKVVFANSGSTMYVVVAGKLKPLLIFPASVELPAPPERRLICSLLPDGGKTWSRTNLDTDFTLATSGATSIKVASDNESMLAYNASGIWRSVNAGQNWYSVTVPVSGTLGTNVEKSPRQIKLLIPTMVLRSLVGVAAITGITGGTGGVALDVNNTGSWYTYLA